MTLGVQGKRSLLLVLTTFLLVLSIASFVLRIFAKLYTVARTQYEDWFMGVALLFSLGTPIYDLYGLSVGLGEHQANVSVDDQKRPSSVRSLVFIPSSQQLITLKVNMDDSKTSIILSFLPQDFPDPTLHPLISYNKIQKICLGYLDLYAIMDDCSFGSIDFECTPVSFFFLNKDQQGHCIPNALRTVSFTNGFLSFLGDCVILCMPIPMI
ncbi:uncharacterized protein EAF02_004364 [Botrytis sinoallii]|uniref:uncharacterized protein n=1 Tax=Botrytis sinoallii TaxID=1463999 RepID=UPI00190244BB|nr:uncharacterized protein EAF02_004364 [Botrytis sinoallii]KAF7885855.1 hypothetical protein EAF02_004364 [Botrytis sinoallii]